MTIHFNNYAKKVGTKKIRGSDYNWFKWHVFVDEPDNVLKNIDYVEYQLHPTFPGPIRNVGGERRSSKFYLETEGYGGFTMNIIVRFIDGTEEEDKYFLDLTKKWPNEEIK